MKTLICEDELKRESLCPDCKKNLDEGKITELDVNVSKTLQKVTEKFYCQDVELKRVLGLEQLIVLSCAGNIGGLIGKKGRTVGEISRALKKRVRVIEHSKDEKKMIQDLIGKARLKGINKLFVQEGEQYKVVLEKKDENKLTLPAPDLQNALKALLQREVTIEFT